MQTLISNPVKQFVYIIETGRTNGMVSVRIGKSKDVEQRRKGIQMYCPNAKVLHTFHFEFNSIFLANVVVPQIKELVRSLNVQDIPAPSEKIATREMSKQEYLALKVQLAKLNNKMSREGELEFFERELRKNIIDRLAEEANRETQSIPREKSKGAESVSLLSIHYEIITNC